MERFFITVVFFSSITKKEKTNFTVKYLQQVHNFAVVPKPVPTYKPETCFICSESSGPLSFININISWNSMVF